MGKPTVEEIVDELARAHAEEEAALAAVGEATVVLDAAKKNADIAHRRILSVEQELKQAVRIRVGGPGQLF